MRLTALALLLFATALSAQTQHGVFMQDIDTKADACTNFFDYANGSWRAANPIPASLHRRRNGIGGAPGAIHELFRLREWLLARRQSHSGVDAALEPPLGRRRTEQGAVACAAR